MIERRNLRNDPERLSVDPVVQFTDGGQHRSLFGPEESSIVFEPLGQGRDLSVHFTNSAARLVDLELNQLRELCRQKRSDTIQHIGANVARRFGPDSRFEDPVGVLNGIVDIRGGCCMAVSEDLACCGILDGQPVMSSANGASP